MREGVGFWEQKEAESFLEFAARKYPKCSSKRWVYVAYLTAINTGARAGELWALRPSDIKHSGELILIERQFSTPINNFAPTKGKNYRSAPCNEHLRRELEDLIEANKVQLTETIFQSENRKPIFHRNFVKRYFHKDLREWGGRKIRFHDLRHTATTLMIAAGVDIKTAQEICGHQNVKTTMNYIHLLSESIRKTARTFAILPTSH
jgi:integrase